MPLPCKIPTGKVHQPLRGALPSHIAALSKMQELVCTSACPSACPSVCPSVCPCTSSVFPLIRSGQRHYTSNRLFCQKKFTLLRINFKTVALLIGFKYSASALECSQEGFPCATHLIFKRVAQCISFRELSGGVTVHYSSDF